tara:strand:+ start:52 stop:690 length:639 start_codon:yes stop_codon:yes gene_type:complete
MAFNVLTNKYVLYVLLFFAITNVLGYLAMHDYESLTLMVAIGALTHYFSRNMIVILSAAILGAVLLRGPMRSEWAWTEKEGFKGKKDKEEEETTRVKETMKVEEDGVDILDKKDDDIAEAANESEEDEVTGGKKMDYDSSIEKQFNSLQGIMKSGDIGGITQDNLAEQMRQIEPMLKTAEGLMAKLEGSGMLNMVERFAPLMEKFIPMGNKK